MTTAAARFSPGSAVHLAALYHPVWTSAIFAPRDFALALAAFLVLSFWKWPPWLVVVLTALAAWGLEIVF